MSLNTERDDLAKVIERMTSVLYDKFEILDGGVITLQLKDSSMTAVFGNPREISKSRTEEAFAEAMEELDKHLAR